jgi:hypothetical protein
MRTKVNIILICLFSASCITKFTPEIDEYANVLVVEGLITDENRVNTVKLSRTIPIGITGVSSPVTGAMVLIEDGMGRTTVLAEKSPGRYCTDSLTFRGVTGLSYKLQVFAGDETYESSQVVMKAVPPVGSVYSEFTYEDDGYFYPPLYSYEVFFDTHDPTNTCQHFRWTYEEVWEYHLPYHYPPESKRICWLSGLSDEILIKNTSAYEEVKIERFPLVGLDNRSTTKLFQKYSILLRQYSLSEEEYRYWEQMKKLTEESGGLYDPVPMPLTGNIRSTSDPLRPALGYFSVSAVATERLFIQNDTIKIAQTSNYCVTDTLQTLQGVSGLGVYIFVLDEIDSVGFLVSRYEQCADCTVLGTNVRPVFWDDDKKEVKSIK